MKQKNNQKIVIAHRGASGYLPEHIMEAKAMAYTMNPDFIEQDLVLSKDDIPVVIHDIYLDDVTDVVQKFPTKKRADNRFYVIDFTFEELQKLRVFERFNPKTGAQIYPNRFPKGQGNFRLHSFSQEIEMIQGLNKNTGKNIGIYPEIKNPKFHQKEGKKLTEIVLKILQKYGYQTKKDACVLQCFDAKELKRIRTELHSELFLVQLIEFEREAENLEYFASYADGIAPWYPQLFLEGSLQKNEFSGLVKTAHQLGLVVHPYTLRKDDLGDFSSFLQMMQTILIDVNSDGVFTDFPGEVVQFLTSKELKK